jgi:predicted AAA+ superfamily ATPase
LARHCDPERRYVSLDDRVYYDLAMKDPEGFIDGLPEMAAIDEVQRVPELTLAIKRNVDANRKLGRFLLTGSANLLQLPRLADSLAGRMECLYLHPLMEAEVRGAGGQFLATLLAGELKPEFVDSGQRKASDLPALLMTGGFPESVQRDALRGDRWRRNYLQSIVERDIHDIAEIKDAADVLRLLRYLEGRTAQLLNVNAMAKDLGHARATIERYLTLLERLFVIRQLPAWHSNRSKRLVKSPKLHFVDSGLAATLGEMDAERWNEDRSRFGHLLESYVLQQLEAMADCMPRPPRFFHYRDRDQTEVDLVIESGNRVWGVEIKAAASVSQQDAKGLLKLSATAGERFAQGIVFYDGQATLLLHKEPSIMAVPIAKLWEM